ncbi:glycoside hydrolase family 127 protein [Glycocaulis profundi]|nr:glycoside hydrolase family 127 protein [Glycocaulis profundi]
MTGRLNLTRRGLMQATAGAALAAGAIAAARLAAAAPRLRPLPLEAVRLKPSDHLDAVEANRAYLHRLEPDRLLHNFRLHAGLEPRGEIYGGWESDTIAGHTLGHYLSACALMHAQTGDDECRERALHIVAELDECQRAAGDGYVAGFTRDHPETGEREDGRRVFEEIARGEIQARRFYINGSWAPFYNWHKLFAGLLDADRHCGAERAVPIAEGLAGHIEAVFGELDEDQVQEVLETEFGGMNDILARLHLRTGEPRWLALAERFHHKAVMDPVLAGRDELAHLHANTQIPKAIGLATLHEATGEEHLRRGAAFFWDTVTGHRSYVIGGNADREYFQEPDTISLYITEQTCESCNTYNMLKLTRQLYAHRPDAAYFDYFERAHLNHIMAHQRRSDGMFAYMVPLMSGANRSWSSPFDHFWCCVGSGMESHAKHGDSIWWEDGRTLFVNLFIPSDATWEAKGARLSMDTAYPDDETVRITVEEAGEADFAIALRAPGWCEAPALRINGEEADASPDANGYLTVRRSWSSGDVIELDLPMALRLEPTPDDDGVVALLHGPTVLAADLGPAGDEPWDGQAPALVSDDALAGITPSGGPNRFSARGVIEPGDLEFAPFHALPDRRTAVYFRRYTPAQWRAAEAAAQAETARQAALREGAVDAIRLGDADDEARHGLESDTSYALSYRFRPGRDARSGGHFAFEMAGAAGPLVLRSTYWGGERDRVFHIEVEGERIATQRLQGEQPGRFIDVDYEIPEALTEGRERIRIAFLPEDGHSAGPSFGILLLRAEDAG